MLMGKKVVPANIADFLTSVSLAYGIMDDGGFTGSGLKLYTNAFSQDERLPCFVDKEGEPPSHPYQPSWCGAGGTVHHSPPAGAAAPYGGGAIIS